MSEVDWKWTVTPRKIVFHDLKMNGLDLLNCHWSLFLQANNLHKISTEFVNFNEKDPVLSPPATDGQGNGQ